MKKTSRKINILDISQTEHRSIRSDKIRTTDINILLNRVRLDKKRTLKKRIIFSLLLATLISSLAIYFII